ncbi:hypothetical protein JL720_7895 [Aureococcus anophagefferens]|nr:hypothetical protein JL720_7895 [Aureococcus anophagefferens]
MACRVWLADPAEFEAQPAGFGKRPGPPTGEERDLAASAAALWNALASGGAATPATRRWAADARARRDGLLRLDGAACCAALREDAREGVVRWRHCAAAAAAAAAAESERDVRRLVDDGLVGSLVRVLTECEVPPEPYGGGHLLRIFACEALARVVAKSDAFSGDAAVISERQLDAVLALFENLHCVDGGDQSTAACRAFARAAFPELDAPVTSVVCRCVEIDRWFGWLRDQSGSSSKPSNWTRFQELAADFASRSRDNVAGIERGCLAGHARAALVPLARSDVYARSAARALLPRVADLVCCGAEEEPQFRTKAMECLAKATAAWARDDAAPLAARASARAPVLGAESPAAARAWKVAFDALPGELDVYERDVSYEDLLTHRAEFLPMDKVERIVEGGALDALVRVVASDGKAKKRATRNRRAALVCAAHDALVCILLAAREAYIERGHVNELVPWLDSGRDKARHRRAAALRRRGADAAAALRAGERRPGGAHGLRRAVLVLLDCVYAISKARDAGWPRVHFDHELGVTAQKILELLPTLVAGERAPLGPAFHLLFDLGLGGHVGSTEDEAASKSLVDLLASARPIEDLGVAEEDRVEAALRKSQRPPPRDVPILLRHAATVALLIFAEGRGGENAWLADICAHGGVPRLLDIVRKDFLLSREGNAENARRAAMHLLRLAAKSAIARPALLRALGDVDARFVTTNVDEDALLEHLDIIQDAAAARYAASGGGGSFGAAAARWRRRRGFFLLRDRDVADLGVRKGAALKIRKHVNDRRAARSRDLDDDAPDFLTCPLSLELFVDPVLLLVDGQTYERSDVAAWIDQHATSPLTREPAKQADLVPNRAVLDAADAFRDGWGRLDEG